MQACVVLMAAFAARRSIAEILGNRQILRVAKYTHKVLNLKADGDPRAAVQILTELIKDRRIELGMDGVPPDKQRKLKVSLRNEINLMRAAIEVLKRI